MLHVSVCAFKAVSSETEYPLHMISREGGPSSDGGLVESVPAEKYKILELMPALILTVTSGTDWLAWPPSSSGAACS